ncbi:MAG TPA: pyroglutamyl-peptidase I [Lachnospiraceae bacterium]|nr:pyroglutamyl-peptidase I [Lachnospiraceae bacterium]
MKILITGFDPFGGETVNPAYEAVKLLPDTIAGAEIIKLEIPTVFSKSGPAVEAGIKEHHPDVVINVGQAGGRSCVTIEKVGINLVEARIPDNAGEKPMGEPLQKDGPVGYFATIPVNAIVKNVREHGLPCHVSYSAGTYVCNCVMYNVLHMAATKYPNIRAGFIHVPFACEQVVGKANGMPSMSLQDIAKTLEYAIEATVQNEADIADPAGGTTH